MIVIFLSGDTQFVSCSTFVTSVKGTGCIEKNRKCTIKKSHTHTHTHQQKILGIGERAINSKFLFEFFNDFSHHLKYMQEVIESNQLCFTRNTKYIPLRVKSDIDMY